MRVEYDYMNNKVVIVDTIVVKGRQNVDWKMVETYLDRYKGTHYVIVSKEVAVWIDGRFADEYAGSRDTHRLKGTAAKAKANAISVIPQLIGIADNERFQENKDEKHRTDAKYGWYRYTSRFRLPVFNEVGDIERYNQFRMEMIVRHAADGKRYLYDFVNIKKETGNPL